MKIKQTSVRLPVEGWKKFREKCFNLDLSQNEVIIELIEKWLKCDITIPQEG